MWKLFLFPRSDSLLLFSSDEEEGDDITILASGINN